MDRSSDVRSNSDHGREGPPSTPHWVRVFVTVVIILLALVVMVHLTGHGLGGHAR